jgi:hypothetical protein
MVTWSGRGLVLGVIGLIGLGVGCDQIFDITERTFGDAGVDAKVVHDATSDTAIRGDGGHPVDAGTGDSAPPAAVTFYVSAAGSGTACTKAAPCPTIADGVAAAAASGADIPAVLVCGGPYSELNLTIKTPMLLIGGYSCATWAPLDGGAGRGGTTVIKNAAENLAPTGTNTATLTLEGGAVRSATVVSGFTIEAATRNGNPVIYVGVLCFDGASPTISNNFIVPDATSCSLEVDGVRAETGASPTLLNNVITGCGPSARGVYADSSSISLVLGGNTITGGGTPSTTGFGLYLEGSASEAGSPSSFTVYGNVIHGGSGARSVGVEVPSGQMSLELEGNAIDSSPLATGATLSCFGTGVSVVGTGTVSIARNRISAGACTQLGGATTGLSLNGQTSPVIANNMIHGGTVTPGGRAVALALANVAGPVVRFNTLVGGVMVGGDGGTTTRAEAVSMTSTTGAVFDDNILVGEASGEGLGVGMLVTSAHCDAGAAGMPLGVDQFEFNTILNAPSGLLSVFCGTTVDYATIGKLTSRLDAAVGDANVLFTSSCPDGGKSCAIDPACTSPPTCLQALFAGWNVPSNGVNNLFAGDGGTFVADSGCNPPDASGWALGADITCAIRGGGRTIAGQPPFAADLYGQNCRETTPTSPLSSGADQSAAGCP